MTVFGRGPVATAHDSELAHRARFSALVITFTCLVVVPLWSVFG